MNYQKLSDYLEKLGFATPGEKISLIFLLEEIKSGAVLMSVKYQDRKIIKEFSEEFNLNYKVVEGSNVSFLAKLIGIDSRTIIDTVFLTKDIERFEILKEQDPGFAGFTDESVGRFLGYPEEAVNYYAEKEMPGRDFREGVKSLEISENELKYLNLINYLPRPEKKKVTEAVEEGKRRADKLEEISKETGIDDFRQYRTKALEDF